jgi:hypothetical protein
MCCNPALLSPVSLGKVSESVGHFYVLERRWTQYSSFKSYIQRISDRSPSIPWTRLVAICQIRRTFSGDTLVPFVRRSFSSSFHPSGIGSFSTSAILVEVVELILLNMDGGTALMNQISDEM